MTSLDTDTPECLNEPMLTDLEKTEIPTNCPHGRPLVFRLDRREIERRFKRT